jgi:hypothetical protein
MLYLNFFLTFLLTEKKGNEVINHKNYPRNRHTRYIIERSDDERIVKRSTEYLASIIETAISMLKRSIVEGVRCNCLHVDSWFTCTEGKNGNLNALLISDLKLNAKETFMLYSGRRVIEVDHRRMKKI